MLDTLAHVLQDVQDWTLLLSASVWVFPVVFAFCAIDGFFPPIPSESVVIALAVTAWTGGTPNMAMLLVVAVLGAWTGDQIAFQLGRSVGTQRLRILRTARGRRAVERARFALERRGATFILAARYVPVGRVAVNMSAGALGYPRRRFMGVSAVAAVMWATCSAVVGVLTAAWLGGRPLLAMAVGVVMGLVLGVLLDRVLARVWSRRDARVGVGVGVGPTAAGGPTATGTGPTPSAGRTPVVSGRA